MAVKQFIIDEIEKLRENAPSGVSQHYLKQLDQFDVEDTVNHLHSEDPNYIRNTVKGYNEFTPIEFEK